MNVSRTKKAACTVSAAALMLGVSSAATIGLHFQDNYCLAPAYSGFPVTLTAFGIAPGGWESLTEMGTGYGCTPNMVIYTLHEVIDTTTSTGGLNPLPSGSLSVTWSANGANFSGFAGYGGAHPSYAYDGPPPGAFPTGEWQIYSSFLRDGLNFGAIDTSNDGAPCGDNSQQGYLVDITGLKSLFTNTPFVVELIAAADSMQALTNAFVIDVPGLTTNSVTYPGTPPVTQDEGGTCGQWLRGHGGGLSTVTGAMNTDHVRIMSNHPQHGGFGTPPNGFNNAGTISGFIITDKPVVTMYSQTIPLAGPGDTLILNPYVIGVPPLACQWRHNGSNIANATNMSLTISNVNSVALAGNYALVVTNLYGAATSQVSVVTVDQITQSPASGVVYDSNPANPQHNGVNTGASWQASSSDGTVTRTGVMDFVAEETNGITVLDNTNFDGPMGTITFWMRSSGTYQSASGSTGGSLFCRTANNPDQEFLLLQQDNSPGQLFLAPNSANNFTSVGGVSDGKWHFVALTFDQSASGGAAWFIDGAFDSTNANAGSWSWPAGHPPIEIGYTTDPLWRDYNGLLDDVRYYGTILSSSQIAAIHSSGALVDTANLQLQFNFTAAPGQGITLSWQETSAVLQSAPAVNGPWTDVTGAASPYTIVPTATQQFFRYRYAPQSLVSNPYLM
jgi:hypothetical protein